MRYYFSKENSFIGECPENKTRMQVIVIPVGHRNQVIYRLGSLKALLIIKISVYQQSETPTKLLN